MNKNEFIDVLEKSLLRLPKADRDDILSDYEAHFALGLENGKTEEEVSASLGDPHELAMTYLENLPAGSKGAPITTEAEETSENETAAASANVTSSFSAPTYGAPEVKKAPASGTRTSSDTPDAGSVVLVVFLSIAAVFILFGIASAWFALPGIAIGCFVGTIALIALGITSMAYTAIGGIGFIVLALGIAALGILAIIACIASVKGIIWLVKKFIELCKNILEGGNN